MDIPKYFGVVWDFPFNADEPHSTHFGNDEEAVKSATFLSYGDLVRDCRADNASEADIEQIGWDVYVSTRATANAPGAIHHGFEGPGA